MNRIYFDHSATTPTSEEVVKEMLPLYMAMAVLNLPMAEKRENI